ncbi:hypothetical protein PGTUg99_025812 [Puccinia graminis f. sp. tritici]|uniref:Uncharacterized protein n=1 Tax=Puccinia graminis f. sp. tritici TaxID=56615 RepID=A0A5B0RAE2_PUCGR|nr:hypothetical protein PGTUg99_025812 [Puccinia graminis f. sp. tritici]
MRGKGRWPVGDTYEAMSNAWSTQGPRIASKFSRWPTREPSALRFGFSSDRTPPERVSDARLLDAAFDGGLAQPTPTRSLGAFHSGRPHQGSGLAVGLPSSQCLPEALELTAVGLLFDAGLLGAHNLSDIGLLTSLWQILPA